MRRSVLIALLAALGLVGAAACSNEGGGGSRSATTASSIPAGIPPASADKANAENIVLTQADLGAELTVTPDDDSPQTGEAFRQCSQNNPVLNDGSDERSAETKFSGSLLTTVGSYAEFWTNEAELKAAMDILASDRFAKCFNDEFKKVLSKLSRKGASINVRTVKLTVASSAAAGVDQTAGLSISMRVTTGRTDVGLFMDMVFLRKGRARVTLTTMASDEAYPSAEIDRLTAILAARLTANAA